MRVVSSAEAYRDWAATFDSSGSPIVALEERYVDPLLGEVAGLKVLEIGCGTGRWMSRLLALGARATGLDASLEMLQVASAKPGMRGRLALGDGRHPPFRPASVDLLLCCLTIGHLQPVSGTLERFAEILRPGGRLVVSDFHPDALRRGWKRTYRCNGEWIEMESQPYSLDQLCAAGLQRESFVEPCFDEPEHALFIGAGKQELFETARLHPAIYVASFRRSGA